MTFYRYVPHISQDMDETTQGDDTPINDLTNTGKALIDRSAETTLHAFSSPVSTNDDFTQIREQHRRGKRRSRVPTIGNTKIKGKKKHTSEVSYDFHPYEVRTPLPEKRYALAKKKKKKYADDKVEEVEDFFLPTVKQYPDHALSLDSYTEGNHKGSLPTEPMDFNTLPQIKRQESGLLSSNESFSELVSPSSEGTLRFYRTSDDADLSCTPSSGFCVNTTQKSARKFKMFLQMNYENLKDDLYPEELADILLSKDMIKAREREKISEENSRAAKSDRLIKALVRNCMKTTEPNDQIFVQQAIDSFCEAKYGYLFASFDDFEEENIKEELPVDNLWMGKLSYFASLKGEELDALELIDRLLAKEVITFDEHQNIMDIPCKQDKIDTLVQFIKDKKTFRHYDSFCQIIKEEYPDVASMLNEDIYERMEISLELEQMPTVKVNAQEIPLESQASLAETAVKMTIEGDSDSGNEIERMIVDANSPKPQEGLQAMVMGDIHCEIQVSFSCIKITLDCLSERSRMLLMQKSKTSPTFLEGWIKELFDVKKMKMLLDRGHHKINFKIQINWPEFVMTRRDIAQNYEYLKRELKPRDYSKILKGVKGGEDVIKFISSKAPRDVRCREFIVYMVTNDKAPIEKLSALLNGSEVIEVIKRKSRNSNRLCTCRLTKKIIVENYTLLEKKVMRIDDIIKTFVDFPGFDDDVKTIFEAISTQDGCKTENLLRAILELPDDELQVCLFEDSLKETDQEDLLKEVISKRVTKEESTTITRDDITRNISFLQQELEPMGFISMLPKQDDKNALRDKILEAKSRRQRCRLFLDFLKDSDETTLKKFTLELRRLNLNYIIDCLLRARQQGLAENCITKEDISENISFLEDMLDPMELRYILIGNENDKSRIALDKVLSAPKKRRCKVFLDIMLNAEEHVFKRFTTYLEKQMSVVHKFLVNARGQKDRIKRSVLESLLDSYSFIVEEIEPLRLQNIFIERQVITKEDFQLILSNQSRRRRAIALMAHVLKGPVSMAQSMMDALECAGYKSLIRRINETNEKFRECPKLYRLKLGGDDCFVFEGTVTIMFDQTTNSTDLDVSVPLSREKIEEINQWIEEGAACGDCMNSDGSEMSVNHGTGPKEDIKHTTKQLKQRKESCRRNTPTLLDPLIHWYDCPNFSSSPASSQFRRADDEAADKSSISVQRSNSVTTINEDSNIGESLDSPTAVVPDHHRLRHNSESSICEYIKGIEQVNSDSFYENSVKNQTASVPNQNCSCEKE